MKYYIYNKLANNGIKPDFIKDADVIDAIGLDYVKFFADLKEEDEVVLVGGDGTLNYFINTVDTDNLKNNVYLRSGGSGNDFLRDLGKSPDEEVLINDYVKDLPTVYVNGIEKKFINGIGFGIDGYCCETADKMKEEDPNKKINYSGIAIKGILGKFDARSSVVSVDGVKDEAQNVWLAAAMKGRFYGGGLMIAPAQDRKGKTLTLVQYLSKSRLNALINFPSISKGEHVKKKKLVRIYTGTEFEVTFSTPCALQIDGETVLNVTTYKVKA